MMKKISILFLLLVFMSPVFASQWFEIFEKKYIDMESIVPNYENNTIRFWTKNLNKNPGDTVLNEEGKKVKYWYSLSYWHIDCTNKAGRIEALALYDLKENLIYSSNNIPNGIQLSLIHTQTAIIVYFA